MATFYFPRPKHTEALELNAGQYPTAYPGKPAAFFVYLLSLAFLATGIISFLMILLTDRSFSSETDIRINYYAQAETLLWIYAISALLSASLLAYFAGKIFTGSKFIFFASLIFIVITAFVNSNLYYYAFLESPLHLPAHEYISFARLSLTPLVIYAYIVLAFFALMMLLIYRKRFGFPSSSMDSGASRYFFLVTIIAFVASLNILFSLISGYSADSGLKNLQAKGLYYIYSTEGTVEGLKPIARYTEMMRTLARRENAVSIDYGTPIADINADQEKSEVKLNMKMVGLNEAFDLLAFAREQTKSVYLTKTYKPKLSARRTRFGYTTNNKGNLTLSFVTEDNVLIVISSAYLSDAQIINFADSLK